MILQVVLSSGAQTFSGGKKKLGAKVRMDNKAA